MMKQGFVQETLADLSGPAALPPIHNLPQWSRINTLDKARYPKPFLKDRLQPLPSTMDSESGVRSEGGVDSEEAETDSEIGMNVNPVMRIQHLEKSVSFLRHQHHEVLSNLHEEIDKLKRDNKDLQFRIVMIQKSPGTPNSQSAKITRSPPEPTVPEELALKSSHTHSKQPEVGEPHGAHMHHPYTAHDEPLYAPSEQPSLVSEEKIEELKVLFLEEEIKELKKALRDERNRNQYLGQVLEQTEKQQVIETSSDRVEVRADKSHSAGPVHPHSPSTHRMHSAATPPSAPPRAPHSHKLPYNATMDPMQVHFPAQVPRPPTMKECEVILRHMQKVNDQQAHELSQLKTDLRDVLYSHKWTPDAYLLAKAYIAEDDAREQVAQGQLPKIPLRQPSRKLQPGSESAYQSNRAIQPEMAYGQRDALSLPALKQTMGTKAMERRRRTQILQKTRLHKEVLN